MLIPAGIPGLRGILLSVGRETPAQPRHTLVSLLSANEVSLEDIVRRNTPPAHAASRSPPRRGRPCRCTTCLVKFISLLNGGPADLTGHGHRSADSVRVSCA
jgi:hypothetical protein